MTQRDRGLGILTSDATPAVPSLPAPMLDYRRLAPVVGRTATSWKLIAQLDTTAQWHQARAALNRGHIAALMGEGEDLSSTGPYSPRQTGIALLVPEPDAKRALTILQAVQNGRDWCPRCGSMFLQLLPVPWRWVIWSILFLGLAPFAPPRFLCRQCGNKWE